jgi:KaiC/GvpD/RAD55 family RecA-like ATPase
MSDAAEEPDLCDFCRHEIPLDPIDLEFDDHDYRFCSRACRDALTEGQFVFSEYHGNRRMRTGVRGLDAKLPQGMPRNSFVLLSGMAGTRTGAVENELIWRSLQRDEPVVAGVFTEPPVAFVQRFLELNWNVLPYLVRGDLRIVDCFTDRVENPERMHDRMNRWNRHLHEVARGATDLVGDPGDANEIHNRLDTALEALGMSDRGVVVVDSLVEFGSLVQPVVAYDFVKDVRAHVCKGRYVPVFATGTYQGNAEAFPHDLGYMADGIVQLEQNGDIVRDTLIKRLRIQKMRDALSYAEWTAYEYTAGIGMVTFDPREEMETTEAPDTDEQASTSSADGADK